MKLKSTIFILILFIYGCAVVVHPTGGPMDDTPPKVVHIVPDSNAVNFNGKNITIVFDEFFEIKDPNGIIFSPPLKEKPKTVIHGKTLVIQPKEKLIPNTTYNIQLINAINDTKENTILPAYHLTFSTGTQIDTGTINGHIYDNLTHDASPNYVVALYSDTASTNDTVIFPAFMTKSKNDGSYQFSGIRPGQYRIYAFEDINNNLKIEEGENIAFNNSIIQVPDTNPVVIYSSLYKKASSFQIRATNVTSSSSFSTQLNYDKKDDILLVPNPLRNDKSKHPYYYLTDDSLHVYDIYNDSIQNYFVYLNQVIKDTIKVKFNKKNALPFLKLNHTQLKPFDTLELFSVIPFQNLSSDQFVLLEDSIPIPLKLHYTNAFNYQVVFNRKEKTSYKLITSNNITDVSGNKYPTDTFYFNTPDSKNFGSMIIKWNNPEKIPYIVELLTDKTKEPDFTITTNLDSAQFILIPANEYYIRIYADTGSSPGFSTIFDKNATRVYYAEAKAKLRGNWTITDIFINNKDEKMVDN